jgi:hypothetical protein
MINWQPFVFVVGVLVVVVFLLCFRIICRGKARRRLTLNHSRRQAVAFSNTGQSVTIAMGSDLVDNNNDLKVHSLSKLNNGVVCISGVTVEETPTDLGQVTKNYHTTGTCHYEKDAPQTLFVYDIYPPGFDHTSMANFKKKKLYDYEFSAKEIEGEGEDDATEKKDAVIHDSHDLEDKLETESPTPKDSIATPTPTHCA